MTVIFLSGVPVLPLSVRARRNVLLDLILISARSQRWCQSWQELWRQAVKEKRWTDDCGVLVLNEQDRVENETRRPSSLGDLLCCRPTAGGFSFLEMLPKIKQGLRKCVSPTWSEWKGFRTAGWICIRTMSDWLVRTMWYTTHQQLWSLTNGEVVWIQTIVLRNGFWPPTLRTPTYSLFSTEKQQHCSWICLCLCWR